MSDTRTDSLEDLLDEFDGAIRDSEREDGGQYGRDLDAIRADIVRGFSETQSKMGRLRLRVEAVTGICRRREDILHGKLEALRAYAVQLREAAKLAAAWFQHEDGDSLDTIIANDERFRPGKGYNQKYIAALRALRDVLAKDQCGGSGSLSETPRPSTAHPLPAGLKPDKQLDGGPSASGPATQPEPRTICHETGKLDCHAARRAGGTGPICDMCAAGRYSDCRWLHQS